MTREEQIDWLCRLKADLNNGVIFTPWNKEFTEALTSILDQKPCEDAISRREVLEIQTKYAEHIGATKFWQMRDDIKALLPVTPQPKTGHWIKYGIPRCEEQHYQCTNCDYYINFGKWGELYTKEFKYCPNCGAKMIEPQESEGA